MTVVVHSDSTGTGRFTALARLLALTCSAVALLLALAGGRVGLHQPWPDVAVWLPFLIVFGVATLLVGAFGRRGALLAATLVALFLVVGIGVHRFLFALLWFASAAGYGDRLARWVQAGTAARGPYERLATALLLGLALYAAGYGLALYWPVLGAATVAAVTVVGLVLVVPLARQVHAEASAALRHWSPPRGLLFALGTAGVLATVAVVGAAAFVPSVAPDDLAYHLRMWAEVSAAGRYRFDAAHQVWALAPFVVDLVHAMPSLLAREDLRGALNLLLLLWAAIETARAVVALGARLPLAVGAAVLLIASPLFAYGLTSLQTELLAAALMARLVALLAVRRTSLDVLDLLQVLAIAALLAATKATGLVLGLACLGAAAPLVWWRRAALLTQVGPVAVRLAAVFLLLAFVALHSYGVAWWRSGNPVLPLFNGVFRSPLFPAVNFSNPTFAQGLDLADLWRMFIFSDAYLEAGRGVAGFQYLVGLPLMAVAALHPTSRPLLLPLGLAAIVAGFVLLRAQQYLRYVMPLMPWLMVAIAVGCARVLQYGPPGLRGVYAVLATLCVLTGLWAHPRTAAWLQDGAVRSFGDAARARLQQRIVPEIRLIDVVNASHGADARVVFGRFRPFAAHLAGTPLFVEWYNASFEASLLGAPDAAAAATALDRSGATHVMWDADVEYPDEFNGYYRERLAVALHRRGRAVATSDRIALLAWTSQPSQARTVFVLDTPTEVKAGAPVVHPFPAVAAGSLLLVQGRIHCAADSHYVVQLLWHGRPALRPHFRLVQCRPPGRSFSDLLVAPDGVTGGALFLNAWGAGGAVRVERIQVDLATP